MDVEDQDMVVDTETLPLCRLCVSKNGKFQIGPNMQINIKKMFEISIDSYDGMSQIMCADCKNFLHKLLRVKDIFKQNQEILVIRRQKISNNELNNMPCFTNVVMDIFSIFSNSTTATPPVATCTSTTITHPNESSVIINLDQSISPAPALIVREPEAINNLIKVKEEIPDVLMDVKYQNAEESMEVSQNESPTASQTESSQNVPRIEQTCSLFFRSDRSNVNFIQESNVTSPNKSIVQDKSISPSKNNVAESNVSVDSSSSDEDMGGDNGDDNNDDDMETSPIPSPTPDSEPATAITVDKPCSDEDVDQTTVRCTRNSTKYNCIFCVKFTLDGTQLKRHIHTHHTGLLKKLKALTVPCSVRMKNIKSTTLPEDWVHFDASKVYQYNPKDSCFFMSKQRRMINPVLAMSSSEDEVEEPLKRGGKRVRPRSRKRMSSPLSPDWTGQDSRSSLSSALNDEDSTRRSSIDSISKVPDKSNRVGTDANTTAASRTVTPNHQGYNPRLVMPVRSASDDELPADESFSESEDETMEENVDTKKELLLLPVELAQLIESCIDKDVEFANSRVEDLVEVYSEFEVSWKNSNKVEISCVETPEECLDTLSDLPLYADMDRKQKGLSHLKLLQPPPSNYNDTTTVPISPASSTNSSTVSSETPTVGAKPSTVATKSPTVCAKSSTVGTKPKIVSTTTVKKEPLAIKSPVKSGSIYVNPDGTPIKTYNRSKSASNTRDEANSEKNKDNLNVQLTVKTVATKSTARPPIAPAVKTPIAPTVKMPVAATVKTPVASNVKSTVKPPVVDITKQNISERPLFRLQQLLKDNKLILVLCEAKHQMSKRLLRISLRLSFKDVVDDYFLDALIRSDMAFLLLLTDKKDKVIDVEEWSEDVHMQVLKSVQGPRFLDALRVLGSKFGKFAPSIKRFSQIVENFM